MKLLIVTTGLKSHFDIHVSFRLKQKLQQLTFRLRKLNFHLYVTKISNLQMSNPSQILSSSEESEGSKVTVDVGTLAVIVIIVVTSSCVMMLISLYCWFRFSTQSTIRCGRCHRLVGVRNVRLPPQLALHPQYNVVHPQYHHVYHQESVVPQPSGNSSFAASRQKPSRSRKLSCLQQQHQQPCYYNVPEIGVDQPGNIQCGDSATF